MVERNHQASAERFLLWYEPIGCTALSNAFRITETAKMGMIREKVEQKQSPMGITHDDDGDFGFRVEPVGTFLFSVPFTMAHLIVWRFNIRVDSCYRVQP